MSRHEPLSEVVKEAKGRAQEKKHDLKDKDQEPKRHDAER